MGKGLPDSKNWETCGGGPEKGGNNEKKCDFYGWGFKIWTSQRLPRILDPCQPMRSFLIAPIKSSNCQMVKETRF